MKSWIEAANSEFWTEVEGEIRQRHQPRLHGTHPCPTRSCCTCIPGEVRHGAPCEVGFVLALLDRARASAEGGEIPR